MISWLICILLTLVLFILGILVMAILASLTEDKANAIMLGLVTTAVFLWTVISLHGMIFGG